MRASRQNRTVSTQGRFAARADSTARHDEPPPAAATGPIHPQIARLAGLIRSQCPYDGRFALGVPDAHAVRLSRTTSEPVYVAQRPSLCIVVQGAKRFILGTEIYRYDASKMLVVSVDLPAAAQVIHASPAEPYLGLILGLDVQRIAGLLPKIFPDGLSRSGQAGRGVFVSPLDPHILDATVRLLELSTAPGDAALLAPLVMDEILIRLLRGPLGSRLARIGQAESGMHKVATAIAWLRANFAQPMRVQALADMAHMSVSAFHQYFRVATSMTPLQYQKTLRLQEARRLMLGSMLDAAGASREVGYRSPSQFGREYARFFGLPPVKDVARLMSHDAVKVL